MSTLNDRIGPVEARITRELVRRALGFGWLVTVNDGEEDAVVKSLDRDAILGAVGHTDETVLRFTHVGVPSEGIEPSNVGFVWLVHGNQDDVIADHTDNERMLELVAGVY